MGMDITFIPVDASGVVTAEQVLHAVRSDTVLVSLTYVNNETGAIHPIEEIGKQLKNAPRVLHVDGVQGFENSGCTSQVEGRFVQLVRS